MRQQMEAAEDFAEMGPFCEIGKRKGLEVRIQLYFIFAIEE